MAIHHIKSKRGTTLLGAASIPDERIPITKAACQKKNATSVHPAHAHVIDDKPKTDNGTHGPQKDAQGRFTTNPPLTDETLLTRSQAGAALREHGFPVADKTLATKATRGGGPPFQLFGSKPLYAWGRTLRWAQSRLSPIVTSTSEFHAVRGHEGTGA